MSPSKCPRSSKQLRPTHAHDRHLEQPSLPEAEPEPVRAFPLPSNTCSFGRHIIALEAIGWRIVKLLPSVSGDEQPLWRVEIARVDFGASITVSDVDLDAALAELFRYASADAAEER